MQHCALRLHAFAPSAQTETGEAEWDERLLLAAVIVVGTLPRRQPSCP
jgi:hypothetical protein